MSDSTKVGQRDYGPYLVCMGACVIALIQVEIASGAMRDALNHPDLAGVIRSDEARLIAQVVSGVGFLGAGTDYRDKTLGNWIDDSCFIMGDCWLRDCDRHGFYAISITSFAGIFFALTVIKRIVRVPTAKKLEIQYIHRAETKEFLTEYFLDRKIVIEDVNFDVKFMEDYRIYTNIYTINLPWGLSFSDVIEELSVYKNITKLRLVDVS